MLSHSPSSASSSPFRLISIGLAATVLLVLCVVVVIWRSSVISEERRSATRESEEILSLIEFLGTSTTRYREATIETGETVWAQAHADYAARLQDALERAHQQAVTDRMRNGALRADSLNRLIVRTEEDAIRLAVEERYEEARALLDSPEFARLIHRYSDALLQFVRASDVEGSVDRIRQSLTALEQEVEVIRLAHAHGLELPMQVQAASGVVGRRLSDASRLLEPHYDVRPDVQAVIDAFTRLTATPSDDAEAFAAGEAAFHQKVGHARTRLNGFERGYDAARMRQQMVMPLLLSLTLLVLALVWMRIVRLVKRNLEEQKQAMEQLRTMELGADALIRSIPDLIFLHDADGNYIDYRAPGDHYLLVPPTDFVNKNVEEVLPPHVAKPSRIAIRKAAETGEAQYLEYELDGEEGPGIYEARIMPINADRVLVIVRDVTRRRMAEIARHEAESQFRTLVEHSLAGIYTIQNGRYLYVNPQFARIVGRTPEELIGSRVLDLIHPDDRDIVEENLRRRISGETDHVHYIVRGLHANGSVLTVDVYGSTTHIKGAPAVIGTLLDVTERERARKSIADLKAFYEETLSRLPIEIVVLDRDLRHVYLNPLAARTPELQRELLGCSLEEYCRALDIDEEIHEKRRLWLEEVVTTGQASSLEETVPAVEGGERHMLRVAAPVKDEAGQVQHIVGYALDVSERKEYERKLLDAKERAEEMARLKSAFLANMSHEIRTPLTGIMGFASLLEEEVQDEQRQFASLIVRSGRRLLDTLNAVLDLSRLEAGEMQLEIRASDLTTEVGEIASFLRSLAAEKGIQLNVITPDTPVRAMIDTGALHIVLNNIIGNAIKFTEDGEVRVEVAPHGRRCCITITDTGVGIDEAFIPQLFEEFKQESVGLTRSHEGAGLGLAITRRLVTMMEGTISVSSEKGAGTTFEITFPRASDQLDLPLNEIEYSPTGNVLT